MGIEWRKLKVSNPTPHPYEPITISGECWSCTWAGCIPYGKEFALVIDEHIVARSGQKDARFSFKFGAPAVPGSYTYWVVSTVVPIKSPPVSIDVIPEKVPDKLKGYLLLGLIGIEAVGLIWLLKGR